MNLLLLQILHREKQAWRPEVLLPCHSSFLGVEWVCKHGVCDSGVMLCLLHHTTPFLWSHKGVEGMVVPEHQENLDKLEGLGKSQMGGKSWIKMVYVKKSG